MKNEGNSFKTLFLTLVAMRNGQKIDLITLLIKELRSKN